ncbi:hypothetical protein ACIO1C_34690 [Streptomyces sp. NPDC087420]|uniref:hypothetical protein n=1 Tax=Streptomyces sp. NPDC087420 TaxID=3365785 RepID=UPI003833AED4
MLPPVCHLCGHPADQGQPPVVLHPAAGPPRNVSLCEPCRSGRPARDSPGLEPADHAWCVLARDAGSLLWDYENGQWLPYKAELRFAEDLAYLRWTENTMRTAQRTALAGRLALLFDNACFVLRYAPARDLLPLRAWSTSSPTTPNTNSPGRRAHRRRARGPRAAPGAGHHGQPRPLAVMPSDGSGTGPGR